MKYYHEMVDKYGFSDGRVYPDGVEQYQALYEKTINHVLEMLGSNTRIVAYERPGVHNVRMLLPSINGEIVTPSQIDDVYFDAIDMVQDMDIDRYIQVEVTVAESELNDFLSNLDIDN